MARIVHTFLRFRKCTVPMFALSLLSVVTNAFGGRRTVRSGRSSERKNYSAGKNSDFPS